MVKKKKAKKKVNKKKKVVKRKRVVRKKEIKVDEIGEGKTMKLKEELFCVAYATDRDCFGNGVRAYMKAYGRKVRYNSARTQAYRLLTKPYIMLRIRKLLDIFTSNEVVDKEIGLLILQSGDLTNKIAAIREYNRLKGRLAPQKHEIVDPNAKWTDEEIKAELARRARKEELGKELARKRRRRAK